MDTTPDATPDAPDPAERPPTEDAGGAEADAAPSDAAVPEAPDAAGAARCVPVDLRDYVRFTDGAATRVRVLRTDHLALDLWCIEPMQATSVLHEPDRDVTYTVIGGRSWFVTDQGEIGLDPMGALLVPSGVVHGIDNRAPDPLIVVASSSPPSDEAPEAPTAEDALAVRRDDDAPGPLGRAWRSILGVRES